MKVDENVLKKSTKAQLIKEISLIDEEISNQMHPVSWARCKELMEYKNVIQEELKNRF